MNIHKFSSQPDKPFHSNGYAEVSNGGSIGSTNPQSFGERYSTDRNRTVVRNYQASHMGRGAFQLRARQGSGDPLSRESQSSSGHRSGSGERFGSSPTSTPRPSFKEPPSRGYNPYA